MTWLALYMATGFMACLPLFYIIIRRRDFDRKDAKAILWCFVPFINVLAAAAFWAGMIRALRR